MEHLSSFASSLYVNELGHLTIQAVTSRLVIVNDFVFVIVLVVV